jgi:hypothetical protein
MNGYDVAKEQYKTGMARFFSPKNLDRYRKLAAGPVDVIERRHVLAMLAEELRAFRRESHELTTSRKEPHRAPLHESDNGKMTIGEHGEHRRT